MAIAQVKVNEKLEAVLLGHAIRRQLLHWVREEYERTVQEIEADNYLPLTNQVIHWPRRNALCFPAFQDQNEKVDTLGQRGDGDKGDGSMSSSASSPCESPNILSLEPSGSETEIRTAMTSIEVGETHIGAAKLASTSNLQPESLQPGSPPFLERMPLSTLPEVQETCRPLHNTDEPQASTLPFPATHSSAREQPENLPLSPCAKLSASVVDQPQWRSGIPLLETDATVGSWLELPEPTLSDLPQDRESLTKLKAQLAMELLWIKQAIASRQNVIISCDNATNYGKLALNPRSPPPNIVSLARPFLFHSTNRFQYQSASCILKVIGTVERKGSG